MMKLFLLFFFIPLLLSAQKPKNEEVKLFQLLEILNISDGNLNTFAETLESYCPQSSFNDTIHVNCKASEKLTTGLNADKIMIYHSEKKSESVDFDLLYSSKRERKELEKLHLDFQLLTDFCDAHFSLEKEDSRDEGESGHQHTKIYKTKSNFHLWIEEDYGGCLGGKRILVWVTKVV